MHYFGTITRGAARRRPGNDYWFGRYVFCWCLERLRLVATSIFGHIPRCIKSLIPEAEPVKLGGLLIVAGVVVISLAQH